MAELLLLQAWRLKNDPLSWQADKSRNCEVRSPSDKLSSADSFITEYDRWERETSTSEIMGHDWKNTSVVALLKLSALSE